MTPKFIPAKVSIGPCNLGMGYFYKKECFAYCVGGSPVFHRVVAESAAVRGQTPAGCAENWR